MRLPTAPTRNVSFVVFDGHFRLRPKAFSRWLIFSSNMITVAKTSLMLGGLLRLY